MILTRTDGFDWPANIHTGDGVLTEDQVWNGTFNYEWTAVGATVTEYSDIVVGTTGSIDFAPGDNSGEYSVSHTMFNYYYGAGEALGTLSYDYNSGTISISGGLQEVWEVESVNGPDLEIYWYDNYDAEDGTVILTRTDGFDWPANINTGMPEAPEGSVWNGTYNYEWTAVGATVTEYSDIVVGTTGSIDITSTATAGESTISHTMFNYYYAAGDALGTLTYDYGSGLISVSGGLQEGWQVKSVNGNVLEIYWYDNYDAEDGTVLLTRNDGYNWPANIYTEE